MTAGLMAVASCLLNLRIPDARSLKDKRSVVHSITGRVRSRFKAAIAEVERQDVHQEAVLQIAVVGIEGGVAAATLRKILALIEDDYPVEIVYCDVEVH